MVQADPSEGTVGGSPLQLTAQVTDDGGPKPVTYRWQSTSGSLDSTTSPTTSWSCTEEGDFTVTLEDGTELKGSRRYRESVQG